MSFRYEKTLRDYLFQNLELIINDQGVVLVRKEVPVGNCIPDIIVAIIKNPAQKNTFNKKISYKEAYLLWTLSKFKCLTTEKLSEKIFEPLNSTQNLIYSLEKNGYIRLYTKNAYCVSPEFKNIQVEIISIEAKLKRWERALEQAIEYKNFSTRSYIALDQIVINDDKIDLNARKEGIGFMTISEDQTFVHSKGKSNTPNTPHYTYLKSSVLCNNDYWESI